MYNPRRQIEADSACHAQLRTPVPVVEEAGLDPGLVRTGVEKMFYSRQGSNTVPPNPWRVSIPAAAI